jgi:hypothetical protein
LNHLVYGENAMSDGMVRTWVEGSAKVMIMCMTSCRGLAGWLSSQAAMFYEE